jgi:hypothetical protein
MTKTIQLKEARAVYAADIDAAQLAREPVILEEDGQPFAAVISLDEYRAYAAWKKQIEAEDDFPPAWYGEKAAFQRMLPELLTTHRGKWVAVRKGTVVDSDENPGELMWRVEQKFGDESVYIDEVLEKPRVYRIPSAWVGHE